MLVTVFLREKKGHHYKDVLRFTKVLQGRNINKDAQRTFRNKCYLLQDIKRTKDPNLTEGKTTKKPRR